MWHARKVDARTRPVPARRKPAAGRQSGTATAEAAGGRGMSVIRSAQLPAFAWLTSLIINGPITKGDVGRLATGVVVYALLAIWTDGMFHFRQRYALEIGETVVNGLRADLFAKTQRQPMSFFHRVKLGRIISRVTSDTEALRVGIQDVLFVSAIQGGQMIFSAIVMAWSDW